MLQPCVTMEDLVPNVYLDLCKKFKVTHIKSKHFNINLHVQLIIYMFGFYLLFIRKDLGKYLVVGTPARYFLYFACKATEESI